MPTPKELLDSGNLKAAIEALTQEVREAPADPQKRTFLFELLAFAGEWDRAEKQIVAAAGVDLPTPPLKFCTATTTARSDGNLPILIPSASRIAIKSSTV